MRTALIVRKSCPAIGRLTEKRRPAPGKRAGLVLSFAGMFEPPRGLAVPVISEAVFASGKSARASAYGGIASIVSIRGEASAEPVTQGTKKQIAAPSCRNLLLSILAISAVLFHFLEIDVGHIIVAGRLRLSSAGSRSACSRSGLGPCVRTLLGVLLGVIHILSLIHISEPTRPY